MLMKWRNSVDISNVVDKLKKSGIEKKKRLIQRIILHIWKLTGNTFCSKTQLWWSGYIWETKVLKYSNIWNMFPVIFVDSPDS